MFVFARLLPVCVIVLFLFAFVSFDYNVCIRFVVFSPFRDARVLVCCVFSFSGRPFKIVCLFFFVVCCCCCLCFAFDGFDAGVGVVWLFVLCLC